MGILAKIASGLRTVGNAGRKIVGRQPLPPRRVTDTRPTPSFGPEGGTTPSGIIVPPSYGGAGGAAAGAGAAGAAAAGAGAAGAGAAAAAAKTKMGLGRKAGLAALVGGAGGLAYSSDTVQNLYDRARRNEQFSIDPTPALGAEGIRSQRLEDFDAMRQSYVDALQELLADPSYADRQRAAAEQSSMAMGSFGDARARGIEESYAQLAQDQQARIAAIEQIAGLSEEVFGEDTEATRAAIYNELYGGGPDSEASGLVPIAGALADMPGQAERMSDITAREALAGILGEASGARFGAQTSQQYGQAYADQLRNQIAMEQFTARQRAEANIANELLRRQQVAEGLQVDLLGARIGLDEETRAGVREEERIIQEILNEVARNPSLQRTLSRQWNSIMRDPQRLALFVAQGIETFQDYVISERLAARARG
jgi:hypothetical protein